MADDEVRDTHGRTASQALAHCEQQISEMEDRLRELLDDDTGGESHE